MVIAWGWHGGSGSNWTWDGRGRRALREGGTVRAGARPCFWGTLWGWPHSLISLLSPCRLPYAGYFGGVSGLSKSQFLKINGFPNEYWGWGGEDDDIFNR